MKEVYPRIKRMLDIVISLTGLILLFPVFVVVAILIKLDSDGPTFFTQIRVGKNQKSFVMYKFRTMTLDAPDHCPTYLLENPDECITKIGIVLRHTSIDELPQLINVLKGDMSIIGPRPLLFKEKKIHKLRTRKGIYSVLPGLTGLAQINGRDNLKTHQKVALDSEYVQNLSFKLDLKIFLASFLKVIKMSDVKDGAIVEPDKLSIENVSQIDKETVA